MEKVKHHILNITAFELRVRDGSKTRLWRKLIYRDSWQKLKAKLRSLLVAIQASPGGPLLLAFAAWGRRRSYLIFKRRVRRARTVIVQKKDAGACCRRRHSRWEPLKTFDQSALFWKIWHTRRNTFQTRRAEISSEELTALRRIFMLHSTSQKPPRHICRMVAQ